MPEKVIENLIGGLNLITHPTQLKDDQCQRLENFEVRPTNIANNLTYMALTARYSYQRLHTNNLSMVPHNLVEFIVRGIGSVVYASGTGGSLNDATITGAYTGSLYNATVVVRIDTVGGAGVADQYEWEVNGSVQASGVAITGSPQSLGFGLSVDFGTTGSTTHHVAADAWSVHVVPNGTRYLVTGGYSTTASQFVAQYLREDLTSTVVLSSQVTTNSSICSFLLFGNNLYYTNGNVAWRRWNGVDDVASNFTTITRYATKHKNKAIYLYDVTNNRPSRIWVSNTGDAETVPAANNFTIGEDSDGLVIGIDQLERLLLVKEKSIFGFYLAPTLADSSVLRGDEWKGSISPLGFVWGPFGTYLYGADSGIQMVSGLFVQPSVLQIYNQIKGIRNQRAALAFKDDQVLISTLSSTGVAQNNRVYLIDLLDEENQKVYQWNANLTLFCQNKGTLSFNNRLKAIEDDGTNRFIVELDHTASTAEASFDCVAQTKDFLVTGEDLIPRAQLVKHITLDFIAPNTTNAVTIEILADGSSVESFTYTPTSTGFNRRVFYTRPHISRGYRISFRISYTQPSSNSLRFAILRLAYNYEVEQRIDQL